MWCVADASKIESARTAHGNDHGPQVPWGRLPLGELSKAAIDSDWPHQIVLPADSCTGKNYTIHHAFCKGLGLSLCVRGHLFRRDNKDFHAFCFAERRDAETFLSHFGGELIDPKKRPSWPGTIRRKVRST
jgi:hypothetical protein